MEPQSKSFVEEHETPYLFDVNRERLINQVKAALSKLTAEEQAEVLKKYFDRHHIKM